MDVISIDYSVSTACPFISVHRYAVRFSDKMQVTLMRLVFDTIDQWKIWKDDHLHVSSVSSIFLCFPFRSFFALSPRSSLILLSIFLHFPISSYPSPSLSHPFCHSFSLHLSLFSLSVALRISLFLPSLSFNRSVFTFSSLTLFSLSFSYAHVNALDTCM